MCPIEQTPTSRCICSSTPTMGARDAGGCPFACESGCARPREQRLWRLPPAQAKPPHPYSSPKRSRIPATDSSLRAKQSSRESLLLCSPASEASTVINPTCPMHCCTRTTRVTRSAPALPPAGTRRPGSSLGAAAGGRHRPLDQGVRGPELTTERAHPSPVEVGLVVARTVPVDDRRGIHRSDSARSDSVSVGPILAVSIGVRPWRYLGVSG